MIQAARAGAISDGAAAYLAASTLYGCRHIELRRLQDPSFRDLAQERVYIWAAKESQSRWVWCPPAVHPWFRHWPRLTPRGGYDAFRECCAAVNLQVDGPLGWHAIRRSLVWALLQAHVPIPDVIRFLRWQSGAEALPGTGEALLYAMPTAVIGPTVTHTVDTAGTAAADAAVWAAHPFWPAWRD